MRIVTLTMCLLAAGVAAEAQERPLARADLPRAVEARLTAIIEDPATRQIYGETTIAGVEASNVVVYNGPLTLSGKVAGELIVIDGDVQFESGSEVTGDVTIIAGDAGGLDQATIGGTVTMYAEGFSPLDRRERVYAVNARTRRVYRDDDLRDWGRSSFLIRAGQNYNRVEGLPIQFGPVIETGGPRWRHASLRHPAGRGLADAADGGIARGCAAALGLS
ncbi:MAG: hypothetical protein ACT4O1_15010 [Gemmatimonadota bacterium]